MTRAKKYDSITHYLKNNNGSQVTLTFTQFDELLFPRHPEKGAYGWLNANYEVVQVNLGKEYVVFNKLVKSSWLI